MTRHASADELALYREGALSRRRAARVGAHLSGCAACAERDNQLVKISSLLARTDVPPMPEHLTERISAALAAEAAARQVGAARLESGRPSRDRLADEAGRIPGRPDLPRRSRGRAWRPHLPDLTSPRLVRGLAVAGAVILLGGVGYVIAGRTGSPQSAPAASGQRTAHSGIKAVTPRAVSGQVVGTGSLGYQRDHTPAATRLYSSNVNFTPADLAVEVRAQVAAAGINAAPSPAIPTASPRQPAIFNGVLSGTTLTRLAACLTRVAAGHAALLVDVARYQGTPATIIVLKPLAASVAAYDVVVVSLACSGSDGHVIARATVPAS